MFREWLKFRESCVCSPRYRTAPRNKGTTDLRALVADPESHAQCAALEKNVKDFGLSYFGLQDKRQGWFCGPFMRRD